MEKTAIIGGSGFLGTRLSKIFIENNIDFSVFDIVNPSENVEFFFLDVLDKKSLDQLEGYTTIINLAAVHRDDVKPLSKYDEVNVEGAVNICNAAKKYHINKIIFTSSVAIYGFAEPNTGETGDANYFNDYGRTKFLAEKVYKEWYEENKNSRVLSIVRPTVIFGEGNRGNVYNLLKQINSKRFFMIGNGKNIKSMAYVENVAEFLKYCISFEKGLNIYNYIDKPDYEMNDLIKVVRFNLFKKNNIGLRLPGAIGIIIGIFADLVSFLIRKPLPISRIRILKFMKTTQFASSVSKTNFYPPISLQDGLIKTINYEFNEDNSNKKEFFTE
ncbi:MAG: NAD-dependent epimerase/dehydratase family protein [Gammaproteobacteria bacterium]